MNRRRRPGKPSQPDAEIQLPFVVKRAKADEEGSRRDFWAVEPSGDYVQDCTIGAFYGRLAVAEMRRLGTGWLLQDIVWAMVRKAERGHKGLIIGFCSEVERALLSGSTPSWLPKDGPRRLDS